MDDMPKYEVESKTVAPQDYALEYNIKIGQGACIYDISLVRENVSIGHLSYICADSVVEEGVEIGNYCSIASGVRISLQQHGSDWMSTHPFQWRDLPWLGGAVLLHAKKDFKYKAATKIGHDVWIGADALVMAGIVVGNGAIIAANAVVTDDVPPYAIVGGTPAKIIRYRFDEETIKALLDIEWWHLTPEQLDGTPFDDINAAILHVRALRRRLGL